MEQQCRGHTDMMTCGQFPSLAITFKRSMVSELPTISSSTWGLYFSTLFGVGLRLDNTFNFCVHTKEVHKKFRLQVLFPLRWPWRRMRDTRCWQLFLIERVFAFLHDHLSHFHGHLIKRNVAEQGRTDSSLSFRFFNQKINKAISNNCKPIFKRKNYV